MSFWSFCCKFPQVYRPWSSARQFPATSAGGGSSGTPELEGCVDPAIDNEGDWKCLSDYAGVRTDGTLWCWIPEIVNIESFKTLGTSYYDGVGGWNRPVLISDDTDWDFVTSDAYHGFAIKTDGSLYAFGDNSAGRLGIGIANFSDTGAPYIETVVSPYRARLATGILRARSITVNPFTGKPTAEVVSGPAGLLGSGATFDVVWSGRSNAYVTNGGSGFTSAPEIALVGNSEADAGKRLVASSVSLSSAGVAGFNVVSGGSGYTFATATLPYTSASATAIIQNGAITGWTLTSAGNAVSTTLEATILANPTLGLYAIVVCGDGDGGAALPVFATRSVTRADFPYDISAELWTSPPRAEVTGGGGTGVVVTVPQGLSGTVKAINVLNAGSNYTQSTTEPLKIKLTYGSQIESGGAYVDLIPSKVSAVVQKSTNSYFQPLMKQSDGKMFPFTTYLGNFWLNFATDYYSWAGPDVESAWVVKNGGAATQISNSGASTSTITGCRYPPFIKAYFAYASATEDAPIGYAYKTVLVDPCNNGYFKKENVYAHPQMPADKWPSGAASESTISGVGSVSYKNIDGNLVQTGSEWELAFTRQYNGAYNLPTITPIASGYPMSDIPRTSSPYTGRIGAFVQNIAHASVTPQWPQEVSFYRGRAWTPPTLEQKVRIYIAPPTHGGTSPYAVASPVGGDVVCGFGTAPTLITDGGGLYEFEPDTMPLLSTFEFPVKVGSDTWQSVSLFGDSSYGVTSSGSLYWWGNNTACGANYPCVTPSPVGQGVTLDISVDGPMLVSELGRFRGSYANNRVGSAGRVCFSVPDHGVHNINANIPYLTEEFSVAPFRWKKSTAETVEYFPPASKFLTRRGVFGGLGYTSTPTVEYLYAGSPAATFSPRLFGQSQFTKVNENTARDTSGRWFYLGGVAALNGAPIVGLGSFDYKSTLPTYYAPNNMYEYVATAKGDGIDPYNSETTISRTAGRLAIPTMIMVSNGGQGYSTASLSYNYSAGGLDVTADRRPTSTSTTTDETYTCDGVSYPKKQTTTTEYRNSSVSSATTSRSQALTINNGAVKPLSLNLYDFNEGASVSPTITGDGSGAVATLVQFAQPFESQFLPLTPAGVDDFSRSRGVAMQNSSLCSLTYTAYYQSGYRYLPYTTAWSSYTTPKFTGFTQFRGISVRKSSDSSVWRLPQGTTDSGNFIDFTGVSAYRVFPLSLTLDSTGRGYKDVATATVTQQAGVATASATYSASVTAIGVINGGEGYSSPPAITLTAADGVGTPGTATAVIAGPISKIDVTSAGNGYRVPPRVVFSGAGIHAYATCTLNASGGVKAVLISDSGRYRNSPPTVSFEPISQIESISLTSGGSNYSEAPDVFVGGGGGIGASATATICGTVSEISLTSKGVGYSSRPTVAFVGDCQTPATATCKLKARVTRIVVTDAGSGYSSTPSVTLSGGEGSGASATATLEIPDGETESGIVAISVTSQGDGYSEAPTVTVSAPQNVNGRRATAVAEILGEVDTITLTGQGVCYRRTPDVAITGGGGIGAKAAAKINGSVDQVTLTSRGEDFSIPPTIVFYNGGGGNGAAATATLSSPGSGAAATATINGSVLFCTHSGSSGLQKEPTVTVSHSSNYIIADLNSQLAGGLITQADYDAGHRRTAARLASRICGTVTGVTVTNAGSSYKAGISVYTTRAPFLDRVTPSVAQIRDEMAETTSTGRRASNQFDAGNTFLTGSVSGGGITSFSLPSGLSQLGFWKKPEVVAVDGISAIPKTCLTLRSAGVRSAGVNSGTISRSFVTSDGVSSASISDTSPVDVISMSGSLSSQSFSGGYRDYFAPAYSTLPTVTLEDEAGSGATVGAMNSSTIVSGGSGYTMGARLVVKGGTPRAWSEPASLTATISNGSVTGVSVSNGGRGYTWLPTLFLVGGGGTGARCVAQIGYGPNFPIVGVTITNNGHGYTSAPTVVVVDSERQFQFSTYPIRIGYQNGTLSSQRAVLQNYKVEYCKISAANQKQMTIDSPVGTLADNYSARFVPFFEDDGYVEGILWSFQYIGQNDYKDGYFCGIRDFSQAPTVTAVGECSEAATFSAKIEKWSDVFSENALKLADQG